MNYDEQDVELMALCVWKEARGEGELGMKAVADVIVNRARAWYSNLPNPIHTVIMAKNQFTSMSVPTDPEFNLEPKTGDQQYAFCATICKPILDGQMSDVTNGALYYCNPKEATSGWFADNIVADSVKHPQVAAIGKQLFYK